MPLVKDSSYRAPAFLWSGHLETIYPYLFRKVQCKYERNRLELCDGDFLDLDWVTNGAGRLLVLCHGLEGSAQSQYMKGMTLAATSQDWDVLAINFRSCSGEMNRRLRMYHHGEIEDLAFVIDHLLKTTKYHSISLCGFSLGGNVILKYLGTHGNTVSSLIRAAVAISVPCDLASSSEALDQWYNYLYTRRFRRSLKRKFIEKERLFPGSLDLTNYDRFRKWKDFDNQYTTALTSFQNAEEYYRQGSARYFIDNISIPTLIINAKNDPFLSKPSYPYEQCKKHDFVYFETPDQGGHVGFWHGNLEMAYSEERTLSFIERG